MTGFVIISQDREVCAELREEWVAEARLAWMERRDIRTDKFWHVEPVS